MLDLCFAPWHWCQSKAKNFKVKSLPLFSQTGFKGRVQTGSDGREMQLSNNTDVLLRVFEFLPKAYLLDVRAVCKTWDWCAGHLPGSEDWRDRMGALDMLSQWLEDGVWRIRMCRMHRKSRLKMLLAKKGLELACSVGAADSLSILQKGECRKSSWRARFRAVEAALEVDHIECYKLAYRFCEPKRRGGLYRHGYPPGIFAAASLDSIKCFKALYAKEYSEHINTKKKKRFVDVRGVYFAAARGSRVRDFLHSEGYPKPDSSPRWKRFNKPEKRFAPSVWGFESPPAYLGGKRVA